MHYRQVRRHGRLFINRTQDLYFEKDGIGHVPLANGEWALIDAEDYNKVKHCNWAKEKSRGYALSCTRHKVSMHRLIMDTPADLLTDHINHNKLDNRKSNLRFCTASQNQWNKPSYGGTSKYKGVSRRRNKWKASIGKNNKSHHIGYFDTEEEAALAYNAKAKKYFGEFACLNQLS